MSVVNQMKSIFLSSIIFLANFVNTAATPSEVELGRCTLLLANAAQLQFIGGFNVTAIARRIQDFNKTRFEDFNDPSVSQDQIESNFVHGEILLAAEADLRATLSNRPSNSDVALSREHETQLAKLRYEIRHVLRGSAFSKLIHEKPSDFSATARDRYVTLLSWLPKESKAARVVSELMIDFVPGLEVDESAADLDARLNVLSMSEPRLQAMYKVLIETRAAEQKLKAAIFEKENDHSEHPASLDYHNRAIQNAKDSLVEWQLVYDRHRIEKKISLIEAWESEIKAEAAQALKQKEAAEKEEKAAKSEKAKK